jgi:hypothetical protein
MDHEMAADVIAAAELDCIEADLARVEESLRVLDDPEADPAAATAWVAGGAGVEPQSTPRSTGSDTSATRSPAEI